MYTRKDLDKTVIDYITNKIELRYIAEKLEARIRARALDGYLLCSIDSDEIKNIISKTDYSLPDMCDTLNVFRIYFKTLGYKIEDKGGGFYIKY